MRFVIPIEPRSKARPRVTRGGKHTYMDEVYMGWRKRLVEAVNAQRTNSTPDFAHFRFGVSVITPSGKMRPDLDNVRGAILDALQDAKVIANDRDAREDLPGGLYKGRVTQPIIVIDLEPAPEFLDCPEDLMAQLATFHAPLPAPKQRKTKKEKAA